MILKGSEIARYLARPDPSRPALLIYGQDAMRVSIKRAEAVKAITGENAEEEMRLNRLSGAGLKKDPAALLDAIKEVGFFPGPRVVQVDDTPDSAAEAIRTALQEWQSGDAIIVVTATGLTKSSALRKLFETHKQAITAPVYDDPPDEGEIRNWLREAGLREVSRNAMQDLLMLARVLDPGDLRQTIEKIALYKYSDPEPLVPAEIALLAPATVEADLDELLHIVAEGRVKELGVLLRRIAGQGINPVGICIAALRHFRTLLLAVADPQGPATAFSQMRPPIFGPRRDRMIRQAQNWDNSSLADALSQLLDVDLMLRGPSRAPQMAVIERMLIRLTMVARARS